MLAEAGCKTCLARAWQNAGCVAEWGLAKMLADSHARGWLKSLWLLASLAVWLSRRRAGCLRPDDSGCPEGGLA
eukprot:CAMPEP_0184448620 /NCGR_PEP_ID=MMETSP0740-20130409/4529_1 /TAXON_ID=385413 /ORGANISM="Thalassiosira miniscula, Strain CCMP1093" /LENGTH=73 /DNA_ID=CAMNT_0026818555 /DNA_START=13 /DNA_END=231 /DNA_ORIENTATION=-